MPLFSVRWLLRKRQELFAEVRVAEALLAEDFWVREVRRQGSAPTFDKARALPVLLDNPLAVPVVIRESLPTYLASLVSLLLLLLLLLYLIYRLAGLLGYGISDSLRKQRVTVVVQPVGGEEIGAVRKNLTGRQALSFRKPAQVGIAIGEEPEQPEWKPGWLKIRRLFRPWTGRVVVQLIYPVDIAQKRERFKTLVREGDRPVRLSGMSKAEAIVEVRRRGKLTTEEHAGWD